MSLRGLAKERVSILNDRTSGAMEIAFKILNHFDSMVLSHSMPSRRSLQVYLREFVNDFRNVQPGMSAPANVLNTLIRTVKGLELGATDTFKEGCLHSLRQIRSKILEGQIQLSKIASSLIETGQTVSTISYGSTVLEALRQAHTEGKLFKIIILESRPNLEGTAVAKALAKEGLEVALMVDAAAGYVARHSDVALVGVDTLFRDGSIVAKLGAYPLAVCCRNSGTPFVALAHSIKFVDKEPPLSGWEDLQRAEVEVTKIYPRYRWSVKSFYFEMVNCKYVSKIVTEKGVFSPSRIGKKVESFNENS
ncbi:MAG: hypothetical protein M1587_00710 [Thaumarchaeota archaeon]|nr:hypothetical protein [Nitrososphaerota archaeon]